ncbi:MAG: hypothetical protein J7K68_06170 [Candidatus Diapherotrites archaeon]|nr:hypothetical protein [Candidatus Diapherotrites archaeon]
MPEYRFAGKRMNEVQAKKHIEGMREMVKKHVFEFEKLGFEGNDKIKQRRAAEKLLEELKETHGVIPENFWKHPELGEEYGRNIMYNFSRLVMGLESEREGAIEGILRAIKEAHEI